MSYLDAFFYGMVQGVAEYLPISSSAHLILFPRFLGIEDPGLTFDVFLHLGTLFSTLVYFWKDWIKLLKTVPIVSKWSFIASIKGKSEVEFWQIVVATLPALFVGVLVHDWVSTELRGPETLVFTLSVGGVVLFISDRFFPKNNDLKSMTLSMALKIGLAQCLALIPGVSRSGATMAGGRILGLNRGDSAKFSFLMSAPVIGAATLYELKNFEELLSSKVGLGQLIVAGGSSFFFGCLAIGGLLSVVRRFGYLSFALYRVFLAGLIWMVLL